MKREKDQKKSKRMERKNATTIIKDSESEEDTDDDAPAEGVTNGVREGADAIED